MGSCDGLVSSMVQPGIPMDTRRFTRRRERCPLRQALPSRPDLGECFWGGAMYLLRQLGFQCLICCCGQRQRGSTPLDALPEGVAVSWCQPVAGLNRREIPHHPLLRGACSPDTLDQESIHRGVLRAPQRVPSPAAQH
ncbi:MAG: hypothetical protein AB7N91_22610 [Candidatus Tectimicrobiota bacterium]